MVVAKYGYAGIIGDVNLTAGTISGFIRGKFVGYSKEKRVNTSEGSETSAQEYLTRQIRFCCDYFCSDIIWKVVFKREVKMDPMKIVTAGLDSPRQDVFVRGLGFVVHSPFGSLANLFLVYVYCLFALD